MVAHSCTSCLASPPLIILINHGRAWDEGVKLIRTSSSSGRRAAAMALATCGAWLRRHVNICPLLPLSSEMAQAAHQNTILWWPPPPPPSRSHSAPLTLDKNRKNTHHSVVEISPGLLIQVQAGECDSMNTEGRLHREHHTFKKGEISESGGRGSYTGYPEQRAIERHTYPAWGQPYPQIDRVRTSLYRYLAQGVANLAQCVPKGARLLSTATLSSAPSLLFHSSSKVASPVTSPWGSLPLASIAAGGASSETVGGCSATPPTVVSLTAAELVYVGCWISTTAVLALPSTSTPSWG